MPPSDLKRIQRDVAVGGALLLAAWFGYVVYQFALMVRADIVAGRLMQ